MPEKVSNVTGDAAPYDALLLQSFGGPEGPDDVIPFLENVLRGRGVPASRMREVAEHYQRFGGVSPINGHCRELIAALKTELACHEIHLPVYWGNRNWHPFLEDTLRQMKSDGIRRVLTIVTSAFASYSGCRQYREDIVRCAEAAGAADLQIDRLRMFYNHPDFIETIAENTGRAMSDVTAACRESDRVPRVIFTAHSIPLTMAACCDYEQQLRETCRLVAERLNLPADRWELAWQSRSGRPEDPWLEPDICEVIESADVQKDPCLVISPVGFLSDHIEVLYDLDVEAAQACERKGLAMRRAATPGTHPRFITMLRRLIQERLFGHPRDAVGRFGPHHDECPADCCLSGRSRPDCSPSDRLRRD